MLSSQSKTQVFYCCNFYNIYFDDFTSVLASEAPVDDDVAETEAETAVEDAETEAAADDIADKTRAELADLDDLDI